jgi:tRNA (guanine10-N2)-methyltransferase
MDPELSFIQANLVRANQGMLVLDPFCGTGGLIIAAAHFGATVMGTEINYQVAKAIGRSSRVGEETLTEKHSVAANFRQYNLEERFLGILIADASKQSLWRQQTEGIFDAIVADPPYGVREKGRKVGNKKRKAHWIEETERQPGHFPEKTVYSLSDVFLDLLNLSAKLLRVGGRVGFWFPIARDEYNENVLPRHPSLHLVANCEQILTKKCSRRLLVFEKIKTVSTTDAATVAADCYKTSTFREKMFPV